MNFAGTVLVTSISVLVSMHGQRFQEQDKISSFPTESDDFGLPIKERFDFIIVGAGTAGCILARRLADARFKVLLLEAGGNPPKLLNVPIAASVLRTSSDLKFLFEPVPQSNSGVENDGGLNGTRSRSVNAIVGKMMGGSSSFNDMEYERGSPYVYDGWMQTVSDRSWKYDRILEFFKKSEDYVGNFQKNGDRGHGGLLPVSNSTLTPGLKIWFDAGEELGFDIVDPNRPLTTGFSQIHFNQKNGTRVSTYSAFVKPAEEDLKPYLDIRRYSVVSKILFEGARASGVYYARHGVPRVASALKEVIICAGTYITPGLLIRSGIGPKPLLKAFNVEPIVILPEVGENLVDHPAVQIPINMNDTSAFLNPGQNWTFEDFEEFVKSKNGPLTNSFPRKVGQAFLESSRATAGGVVNWPNLQISYYVGAANSSAACSVALTRPLSRGSLTFTSNMTRIGDLLLPTIDYDIFEKQSDVNAIIEGIEFCLIVLEGTETFKKIGAKYDQSPLAECNHEEFRSKAYWSCYVRYTARTTYNAVGTCRMGRQYELERPRTSVVDPKLRVHDVQNLRIVDASVMPTIPNANVAAATMMIAEKAADIIIKHHCRKTSKTKCTTRT